MHPNAPILTGPGMGSARATRQGPLFDRLLSLRERARMRANENWKERTGILVLALGLTVFLFVKTPDRADGDAPAATSAAGLIESAGAAGIERGGPHPRIEELAPPVREEDRKTGREALEEAKKLLEKGVSEFSQIPAYEAKFFKQEQIDGTLLEGEEIDLKLAHNPLQIYMKWQSGGNKGQQAIYSDGEYDNKLLVQPGGVAGRLCGVLRFDPDSEDVLAQSRYPATNSGIVGLARNIINHQQQDLQKNTKGRCELLANVPFEGRTCYRFVADYASPEQDPVYSHCEIMIDSELLLPIWVRNLGWVDGQKPGDDDEDGLVEFYSFSDINTLEEVRPADFDPGNRRYAMRMRDRKTASSK